MNNKDLFNAINNIDEKIIEDAGKYLKKDAADPSRLSEPVEITPAEIRLTPLKIISPIAAAVVLVVGAAVAFKLWHGIPSVQLAQGNAEGTSAQASVLETSVAAEIGTDDAPPAVNGNNNGIDNEYNAADPAASADGSADAPTAAESSDYLDYAINNNTGELSFYVFGPDMRNLTYDDITAVRGETGAGGILTENNWTELFCDGFAYAVYPNGNNINTVDNFDADVEALHKTLSEEESLKSADGCWRLYVGDDFYGLTVAEASSTFARSDDAEAVSLERNYVRFKGEAIVNAYIVKSDGGYYLVFRNGCYWFPLMNIAAFEPDESNEKFLFGTRFETFTADNFQYVGELPAVKLDNNVFDTEDFSEYFTAKNYRKALVTLSDISIELSGGKCTVNANISHCLFQCWESLTEPTFDVSNGNRVAEILDYVPYIEDLRDRTDEISRIIPCDDIRIYSDLNEMNFGTDTGDGELKSGMIAAIYNKGKLVYTLINQMNPIF